MGTGKKGRYLLDHFSVSVSLTGNSFALAQGIDGILTEEEARAARAHRYRGMAEPPKV